LPIPASNPRIVTRLFMLDLESHPPGTPIRGIRLQAVPSKPRIVQSGLFIPLSPEPEKLELTLARIAAIVGSEKVGTPQLRDTWERHRFEMKPWGRQQDWPSPRGIAMQDQPERQKRINRSIILRVFRPIVEVTVYFAGSRPQRLACSKFYGRIESASGPWHSSGNWWGCYWSRDEWDVALRSTADSQVWLLRIFRNTLNDRWYAEGVYD
jgi:protein ImuB